MRTAITSLIVAGVSAAAVSMMSDKRTRNRVMNMMEPITRTELSDIMPKRSTLRQMRKRITRTFS